MTTSRARRRTPRILIAALAAITLAVGLVAFPGHGRGADAAAPQSSVKVAVVPGFAPPTYPGFYGVPPLPVGASQLAPYHFTQLSAGHVTASALSGYDTVILYGIRWSDVPASGRAAIDAFAQTHKVLIWDADDTGAQNYSSFIHPFSTQASDENFAGKPNDSVVSFPTGTDFLASDNPSSPYYLDPNQLVTDRDEINDMNAMKTGTQNWAPALIAANAKIPKGGWPIAWSYGVIGNHTGMTVYSGLDADAFGNSKLNPNNAITELRLQLQAPFRTTPDPSCAPGCTLDSSGGGPPHAACSFAKKIPAGWVHGHVPVVLKTSVAAGITGRVLTPSGRALALGTESGNRIHLAVKTRSLRSNHVSRLKAVVYLDNQQACSKSFRLKVDNTPPRLLHLHTSSGSGHAVSFRVSEKSKMWIVGGGPKYSRWIVVPRHKLITVTLPGSVRHARLILRDRAGNTIARKLVW